MPITAHYEPTPEEIRLACLEIQAGWTEAEERQRRAVPSLAPEVREVVASCNRNED